MKIHNNSGWSEKFEIYMPNIFDEMSFVKAHENRAYFHGKIIFSLSPFYLYFWGYENFLVLHRKKNVIYIAAPAILLW